LRPGGVDVLAELLVALLDESEVLGAAPPVALVVVDVVAAPVAVPVGVAVGAVQVELVGMIVDVGAGQGDEPEQRYPFDVGASSPSRVRVSVVVSRFSPG
jgi:hypothetical protein